MGRQQGLLLGPQIAALRKAYLEGFFPGAVERAGALAFGLTLVPHMPAACAAELKGMADTSGVDLPGLIFANTFADAARAIFCSVVVASGKATADGRTLFARNLDFPSLGLLHKTSVVVVCHQTAKGRRPFVAVGWPGLVGVVSGMNDAGLCVATLVSISRKGVAPGMPFAMMHREVLEQCATPEDALALVKRTRRTSANNLVVAAPDAEPLTIEFTSDSVAARRAKDGLLLATNHFRCPELAPTPNPSCDRFETLDRETSAQRGRLGLDALKKLLHAVYQDDMTVQSMLFEPAARKLHLATGRLPASAGRYVTLDCRELLAAK